MLIQTILNLATQYPLPILAAIVIFAISLLPSAPELVRDVAYGMAPFVFGGLAIGASAAVYTCYGQAIPADQRYLLGFVAALVATAMVVSIVVRCKHREIWTNPASMIAGSLPIFCFGLAAGLLSG
jgi:hypothetical protein